MEIENSKHDDVFVVIVSARAEWNATCEYFSRDSQKSPLGDFFEVEINIQGAQCSVVFFHGGWGKIAAAASTQYVIDRWNPCLVANLGTCGGIRRRIERETIILAEKTIVYDLLEMMGDPEDAFRFYATDIDLSWISGEYPVPVRRSTLVSADRDLLPEEIPLLVEKYDAVAGDWESGAIAYVCARNQKRCLILRGVSDLVSARGGEAYQNIELFESNARKIMIHLLSSLPMWLMNIMI